MRLSFFVKLFFVFLLSCSVPDINDESKRNTNWIWIQDLEGGRGQWHKIGGKNLEEGEYTLFHDNGSRREVGRIKNHENIDTIFLYSNSDELFGYQVTEGNRYHSLDSGKYTIYHQNGSIRMEANYITSKKGTIRNYTKDGIIINIIKFTNGLRNGKSTEYFDDGSLKSTEEYVNDTLNGLAQYYFKSGSLAQEVNIIKGLREGKEISYHESGEIYRIRYLKNDQKIGTFIEFYKNRQIRMITQCVDNKFHGESKIYYENGKLFAVGNYKKGKLNGSFNIYGSEKGLFQKLFYNDNVIVKQNDLRDLTTTELSNFISCREYAKKTEVKYRQLTQE